MIWYVSGMLLVACLYDVSQYVGIMFLWYVLSACDCGMCYRYMSMVRVYGMCVWYAFVACVVGMCL